MPESRNNGTEKDKQMIKFPEDERPSVNCHGCNHQPIFYPGLLKFVGDM